MDNLPDVITAALTVQQGPLWLPSITRTVAEMGQEMLWKQTGITMLDYGTARVLAGDARAPRHLAACISFCPGSDGAPPQLLAECLRGDVTHRYQEVGLTFQTLDEITHTAALNCLQEAIDILMTIPTLHHTVATLVRVCHLLKLADEDYDVSYSDPQVPFSIFVSIPKRRSANNAIRLAESIVHEAMHLQLSLVEQAVPLVHPSEEGYFSPWKGAYRSPQGVLHALYVFRVIDQCFEQLLELFGWSRSGADHIRNRRRDIAVQVREIDAFKDSTALTVVGNRFVQRLMNG